MLLKNNLLTKKYLYRLTKNTNKKRELSFFVIFMFIILEIYKKKDNNNNNIYCIINKLQNQFNC